MATLHVRNFPDSLYEALRARSEANGRSIGAETIQLVEDALARQLASLPAWLGRRRRPRTQPFQRFTPLGRTAVGAAQDEARALGHDHVGTEHVLLGLLQTDGVASDVLRKLGLTVEEARAQLLADRPRGEEPVSGELPFAPETKKALELALRESLAMHHTSIGTEHVLLGIASEGESLGARIVLGVEPSVDRLRRLVRRPFGGPFAPAHVAAPPQEFHVVELEGDAGSWQAALNDAAAAGYELVQIVERRAIFRQS